MKYLVSHPNFRRSWIILLEVVAHLSIEAIIQNAFFSEDLLTRITYMGFLQAIVQHYSIARVVLYSRKFWEEANRLMLIVPIYDSQWSLFTLTGQVICNAMLSCKEKELTLLTQKYPMILFFLQEMKKYAGRHEGMVKFIIDRTICNLFLNAPIMPE